MTQPFHISGFSNTHSFSGPLAQENQRSPHLMFQEPREFCAGSCYGSLACFTPSFCMAIWLHKTLKLTSNSNDKGWSSDRRWVIKNPWLQSLWSRGGDANIYTDHYKASPMTLNPLLKRKYSVKWVNLKTNPIWLVWEKLQRRSGWLCVFFNC